MAKDVKCSVDNCKYYCHCVEAKKTSQTACDTFECRQ